MCIPFPSQPYQEIVGLSKHHVAMVVDDLVVQSGTEPQDGLLGGDQMKMELL